MTKTRSLSASILISIAGVAAYIIGRSLSVPGVDTVALNQLLTEFGPLSFGPSPGSLLGVGLGWLLIAWLVEGFAFGDSEPRPARVWLFVCYLALAALTALTHAAFLQSFLDYHVVVVPDPGMQFVIVATLTQTAGAALLWFLGRWIGWRGLGQGVLILVGVELLMHAPGSLLTTIRYLEVGVVAPAVGLFTIILSMAPLIIGLGLLSFRRIAWPQAVLGVRFDGPIDLLVAPYAAMTLVWGASLLPAFGLPPGLLPLSLTAWLTLALAIALVIVVGRTGAAAVRPGYLVAAIATPLLGVSILVIAFVLHAGPRALEMLDAGPFAGDGCFVVTLATDANTPDADRDSDDRRAMMTRIEAAGVDPRLTATPPGKMELELRDISAPGDLMAYVLPRRHLTFRMMAKDQTPLQPRAEEPLVNLEVERDYDTGAPYFVAPSREALAPLLARLEDPSGALIECRQSYDGSSGEKCSAWLLDAPVLAGADVESAEVTLNPDMGQPEVALRFDDRGRQRFGEVTAANVGNKLAIVVDDQINSMPKIMEAITGGSARITLGRSHAEDTMQEARAMVAALTTGRLEQTWIVSSIASCTK